MKGNYCVTSFTEEILDILLEKKKMLDLKKPQYQYIKTTIKNKTKSPMLGVLKNMIF